MNPGLSPRQGGSQAETLLFAGRRNGSPEVYNLPVMHRSWHCLSPMWLTSPRVKRSNRLGSFRDKISKASFHWSLGFYFSTTLWDLAQKKRPKDCGGSSKFFPSLKILRTKRVQAWKGRQSPKEIEQQGKSQYSRPTIALVFPQSTRTPLFQQAPGCSAGIGLEFCWNPQMGLPGSDP